MSMVFRRKVVSIVTASNRTLAIKRLRRSRKRRGLVVDILSATKTGPGRFRVEFIERMSSRGYKQWSKDKRLKQFEVHVSFIHNGEKQTRKYKARGYSKKDASDDVKLHYAMMKGVTNVRVTKVV